MRFPDFIIIGAAKAGTTSLYDHLARHPGIFASAVKEPEFFAREEPDEAGLARYAAHFRNARPDQLCGEASTIYSLSPHFPAAPARIASTIPDVRLIYIMREPVSRAYSYYVQIVKNYQNGTGDHSVNRTFEDFIDDDAQRGPRDKFFAPFDGHLPDTPGLVLDGSDYALQIGRYLEFFPSERFLFLIFEEFIRDPGATLDRVCAFLGVAPMEAAGQNSRGPSNVAADHFRRAGEVRIVKELQSRYPPLARLVARLPRTQRAAVRRVVTGLHHRIAAPGPRAFVPPPMAETTQATLRRRFSRARPALAEMTGIGLERLRCCWGEP